MTRESTCLTILFRSRGVAALMLAICMAVAWPALGQEQRLEPAAPPPPEGAAVAPEAPEAPVGLTQRNGRLLLNFHDASIDVVLNELSSSAGFIVVKEVKPEGRVTLVSKQPIDASEAVSLLNTVLRNAGYAAIQQERILKIVKADAAKRLNIPVRVGNDPEKIAVTDELITQVVPLRFADAMQLKQDLQPLINPQADFASNASSNALVITDTSANVRRVVQIVAALDTSLADAVDVRVFQLRYANAASAAKLINDVFGTLDVKQEEQDNAPPWVRRRQPEGQQQQPEGTRARNAKVTASSDDRTNSVVVSGPADTLEVVSTIVRELDANPAAEETVFVYRLRNAQSLNVESVLNSLFNGTQPTNRSTQNTLDSARGTSRTSSGSGSGAFGSSGGMFGGNTGSNRTYGQNQSTGQRTTSNWQGGNQTRLSTTAAQTASDLAGQVSIIADPDTNSLLVRTNPVNYERVKAVLEELDRAVSQVLIKVLIAEVTHDDGLDFGAEFSILNIRPSGMGQEGGTSFNIPVAGAAATGMIVQVLEENFTATIRALETQGKLDVLSRPYILASDNQLASITVGQEVPFITNSRITDDGQTINTIEYDDIGILLDVVPHINPDGLVILDVAPEISTLTGTTVPISELVSAPVIAKRSAQSRVAVRTGQTVVIGGLMEDRITQTINKVPLLGDIPWIGNAFKRTETDKTKTELLIFLTPHVAADPVLLQDMGKDEVGGTKLVPNAVRPGVFDEHMQGLQRGEPGRPVPDQPPAQQAPADPTTKELLEGPVETPEQERDKPRITP